jgi:hypothetical protein
MALASRTLMSKFAILIFVFLNVGCGHSTVAVQCSAVVAAGWSCFV